MTQKTSEQSEKLAFFFIGFILLLACFRMLGVLFTPLNLGPDEAQYWRWSKSFDWGYFSKPPMVAWVIGAMTNLFGDHEWAIRFASPIFHTGTAIALFMAGQRFWSTKVGIYAGLCFTLMTAIWLSSGIMSTDVPLLFFWSLGLFFFLSLRTNRSWVAAIGLGVALGLGFLSKYAMVYFLIGMALSALIDPVSRKALLSLKGLAALALFLAIFAPHLLWNAENGFKTVGHTADNANWGEELLNPENGFKFFFDQFAVFGPLSFLLLLSFFGLSIFRRKAITQWADRRIAVLACFVIPPLLIILVQAFISRAHANWAATAYPAACLILAIWATSVGGWVRKILIGGFALSMVVGVIFTTLVVLPVETQIQVMGGNATKRLRGWPETTQQVKALASEYNASAVIVDEREIWHGLDYYGRDGELAVPVRAWRREDHPKSASEEALISQADAENALILSYREGDRANLLADFAETEAIGELEIDLGGNRYRRFEVYIGRGFEPKPRPLPTT